MSSNLSRRLVLGGLLSSAATGAASAAVRSAIFTSKFDPTKGKASKRSFGGGAAVTLPGGAQAVWYANDYVTSPRRTIPNSLSSGPLDANLASAPRRLFKNASFWTVNTATATDANQTAPDGTSDASTIAIASAVTWFVAPTGAALPTGTYTYCCCVKLISGDANFRFGDTNAGTTAFVATSSWQRITKTVTVSSGAPAPLLQASASPQIQSLAICDFEIFAGSADLNPAPLSAAPRSVQNQDIKVGRNNADTASTVTNGWLIGGGYSLGQLLNPANVSTYTIVYIARRQAGAGDTFQSIINEAGGPYTKFNAGLGYGGGLTQGVGVNVANAPQDGAYTDESYASNGVASQPYMDLWVQKGSGPYVAAHRHDGTRGSSFINGIKLLRGKATTFTPFSAKDFYFGALANTFTTGNDIAALAYYPNVALSDAQIVQAQNALVTRAAIILTTSRTVIFNGTSITYGLAAKSYAYLWAPNASSPVHGVNAGVSSSTFALINASVGRILSEFSLNGAPPLPVIWVLEIGANDLATVSGSALATSVAGLCDQIRAAGHKVILHTVLNRTDAGNAGNASGFDTQRLAYNAIITGASWMAAHVDAICDIAGTALGTSAQPDSTTYFAADKVHPNLNGYTAIWEPLIRPILNGFL